MTSLQSAENIEKATEGTVQQLSIANRVWYNKQRFEVNPAFSVLMSELYDQDKNEQFLIGADFNPSVLVPEINEWVESKTADQSIELQEGEKPDGMIKNLLSEQDIKPEAVMVLVNALYFQAQWYNQMFETPEKLTFQTVNKKVTKAAAVRGKFNATYLNNEILGVRIPFRTASIQSRFGGDAAAGLSSVVLELFQEKDGVHVSETMQNMTAQEYAKMWDEAQDGEVLLTVPKFNFTYKQSLKPTLQALGMSSPFQGSANFTGLGKALSGENVYIGDVIQKTAIELDEKGLKAAAATAVIMTETTTVQPDFEPVEIRFDKPFALVLRDTKTDAVMFAGIVNDPTSK